MNIQIFKSLILILMLFSCKDIKNTHDMSEVKDYEDKEIENADSDDVNTLESLVEKYQLSSEEQMAVQFLKSVLTNPLIAKDAEGVKNYTEEEFHEFLTIMGANKTKEAISEIVITMTARDNVRNAIYSIPDDHPQKQNFENQFKEKEEKYLRNIKIACSSNEGHEGAYIALRSISDSFIFKALKSQIEDTLNEN
ncbi:hypothetical protein F0310_04290 (plasmid) [Borrelia sp. A-FGy1]|uniref:BTA121 domain-containing protein surface lipoprotein n=1 Tax=Borrelia sp. A-FGy1 TaxID=2608247 RepID=UPI0015F55918|nr:hypothetical protein [Borrelia sp. A-FGy1]QMU99637.1 hypothetical protein F0310_04290 [Borrelia sp. A-FGy1]